MENISFNTLYFNQTTLNDIYEKAQQEGLKNGTNHVGFFIDVLFFAMMITFILRHLPVINENRKLFSEKWMKRFEYVEGNAYTFSVATSYTLFLMKHALF